MPKIPDSLPLPRLPPEVKRSRARSNPSFLRSSTKVEKAVFMEDKTPSQFLIACEITLGANNKVKAIPIPERIRGILEINPTNPPNTPLNNPGKIDKIVDGIDRATLPTFPKIETAVLPNTLTISVKIPKGI